MLTINEWKGGAAEKVQIIEISVLTAVAHALYRVTFGTMVFEYRATSEDTVETITAALVELLSGSTGWTVAISPDNPSTILVTGSTPGRPLATGIAGSNPASSTVSRLQPGQAIVTKQIDITLPASTTGGSWSLSLDFGSGAETLSGIAHNETAAQLGLDIASTMATPDSGDVGVELINTSPRQYRLTIAGDLAGTDPTATVNATLLEGTAGVEIETIQTTGSDIREIQVLWFEDSSNNAFTDPIKLRMKLGGAGEWSDWTTDNVFQETDILENLIQQVAGDVTLTRISTTNLLAYVVIWQHDNPVDQLVAQADYPVHCESTVLQEGGSASRHEIWHGANATELSAAAVSYTTIWPPEWFTNGGSGSDIGFFKFAANTAVTNPEPRAGLTILYEGAPQKNERQRVIIRADAGAFVLSTEDGNTGSISHDVNAAGFLAILEAVHGSGNVNVIGYGTEEIPFYVEYIGTYEKTDVAEMAVVSSTLTGGIPVVPVVSRPMVPGRNERQLIRRDPLATDGSLLAAFQGRWSADIAYDANAATWATKLAAIATIGAGNVATEGTAESLIVEFQGDLANQSLPLIVLDQDALIVAESTTMTVNEVQPASGPEWWNNADNWTLGHAPHTGEQVVLGSGKSAIRWGLTQAGDVTVSGTQLTLPQGDLVDGQVVRLRTTDTFPTAEVAETPVVLSATTNYYVVTNNRNANGDQVLEISQTAQGPPIEFTDTGSGTLSLGVALAKFQQYSKFTGKVGWPRRDGDEWVDQPRYLRIDLLDPSGGVPNVELGIGDGSASSLINCDFGGSYLDARVLKSSGGNDTAINLLTDNVAESTLLVVNGVVGIALEPTETAALKLLQAFGGRVVVGNLDASRIEDYGSAIQWVSGQATEDVVQLRKN